MLNDLNLFFYQADSMDQPQVLSIVIPVYNEEPTIHLILQKLETLQLPLGIQKEVIAIDDCSSDGSFARINELKPTFKSLNLRLLRHEKNQGKGAALRTGINEATGDLLVIQDADLEYDPNELKDLLQPFIDGVADVVYGSRFMGGNAHRILFFWHSLGNKLLTFLCNMASNLNLTDMETCYKMFRTNIIQSVDITENRFGFEPEVTCKISRIPKIRVYEVGISYYGRTFEEGKKIGWKDGFRAIYCIVKYGFLRRN